MVLEGASRCGREPAGQGGAIDAKHGRRCQARRRTGGRADRRQRLGARCRRVVDQPELVDAVLLAAEGLVQLALQPEMALARRITRTAGDDDEEPLPSQAGRCDPAAAQVGQR